MQHEYKVDLSEVSFKNFHYFKTKTWGKGGLVLKHWTPVSWVSGMKLTSGFLHLKLSSRYILKIFLTYGQKIDLPSMFYSHIKEHF